MNIGAELIQQLEQITASFSHTVAAVSNLATLAEIREKFLAKQGSLNAISASFKGLSNDDKRLVGKKFQEARKAIEETLHSLTGSLIEKEKLEQLNSEQIDLTAFDGIEDIGSWHPVATMRKDLEDVLVSMGYTITRSREVEEDWYNFEALNFPPNHPARSMQDTFYIEKDEVMLRTQTSNFQIHTMKDNQPPLYVATTGRTYRNEADDARHSSTFHQLEVLAVDEGITFGDLAGTIETFMSAVFQKDIESRLIPSFFPFTEPSAEMHITCIFCEKKGCRVCSNSGWIELGGCGMVHPNVFKAVGYDPEKVQGFALGFGVERIAMLRHEIDTISTFYDGDVRALSQFKRFA